MFMGSYGLFGFAGGLTVMLPLRDSSPRFRREWYVLGSES
jgi:hypothetical protein